MIAFVLSAWAVEVPEPLFRDLVADSRELPACRNALALLAGELEQAKADTVACAEVAVPELDTDEDLVARQVATIEDLGRQLERSDRRLRRARAQRNVAGAVAAGLLVGAGAAVALAL